MVELANLVIYSSGRMILGAFRTPTAVGLYEGPVRATTCSTRSAARWPSHLPSASRYAAAGDERPARAPVRGSRYTLALFVPLAVTLMALAEPIIGVWLGERYRDGATALTVSCRTGSCTAR